MKTTMTMATNLNCSPFEIFNQDVDEVILLLNFYLQLGNEQETEPSSHKDDGFWNM